MDDLILLLIQGLIRLFSGKKEMNPPPRKTSGSSNQVPPDRGQDVDYFMAAAQQRLAIAGRTPKWRGKVRPAKKGMPPIPAVQKPVVTPAAAVPAPVFDPTPRASTRPIGSAKASGAAAISASRIRRMIVSQPATLRSLWALNEVLQKPVALRE